MTAELPVIDFASYSNEDRASLRNLADAVDTALRDVGFMAIRHLGIEPEQLAAVFAASRQFFRSELHCKQRSAYRSASENFGYQGIAEEHLDPTAPADLKETFTMRDVLRHPANDTRWPSLEFAQLMRTFYGDCLTAAFRLMHVLTVALETQANFFERCHSGENVTLRLLHYPANRGAHVKSGQLGAGAHTDYGLLTLLFQRGVGGLEVRGADGDWLPVAADPDAIVINAGDLLEVWTNGRYRSTPHRVQPQLGDVERQSIAMFIDPDSATEVRVLPSCTGPDNPVRFTPTTAGRHLTDRIEASHKARFAS